MVVLQTRKALAWHAGRVSGETLLALKSVWPRSSTCNQPKVPEQLPGQSSKSWGGAETMVFISNPPPSSPGGGLNGASDYFCGSAWYPPSLPTYRSTGILVDRSPGNPIPWSHVSQEPRSVLELWRKEDEGCRDNGTRGCFKVCTGLVLESLRLVPIGSTEGAGELGLGSSSSWLFRAL